jgi:hypothetical protein
MMSELLRPTPGSVINSSCVCGTLPSNFCSSMLLVASMFFDLALNNPAGLMAWMI